MLILFNNGPPAPLRYALKSHIVVEAIERGWDRLVNGEPIAVAEAAGFHARSNQRDRRRFAAVDLPHCRRTIKRHQAALTEATAAFTLKAYGSSFHPGAGSAAFANRQP